MIAPDFALPDQNNKIRQLSDYRGKWLVVYFYPQDDTPECTIQACDFRDQSTQLRKRDLVVLGVSADSIASHQKFAQKYSLNFPLLSDPAANTIMAYDAWGLRKFPGKDFVGVIRMTYLIDPQGKVVQIFPEVTAKGHVDLILQAIDKLQTEVLGH
jgi:peroxiredoxin Q/BCP